MAEISIALFSEVHQAGSTEEILEDRTIQMIVSAGIPCDRAPLGRVMQHGKDYRTDKPGLPAWNS
jgi:hypothetical protein